MAPTTTSSAGDKEDQRVDPWAVLPAELLIRIACLLLQSPSDPHAPLDLTDLQTLRLAGRTVLPAATSGGCVLSGASSRLSDAAFF